MKRKLFIYLFISIASLLLISIGAMYIGIYDFQEQSILVIIESFFIGNSDVGITDRYVFLEVRLARIVMAILIGSALAVSGTVMQGIFKNPLATPDLIGITSGATLMAAITIVIGGYFNQFLPVIVQNSLLSIASFFRSATHNDFSL